MGRGIESAKWHLPMQPSAAKKFRILVLEDDENLGPLLQTNLRALGFATRLACRGDDGLEAFLAFAPHLVLLDLVLPDMDGHDVLRALRASSTVPVIILSSLQEENAGLATFRGGADDYVVKPFMPSLLMARVVAHLRRSYGYLPPETTPVATASGLN